VNHVNTMLEGNPDDVVLSEISGDGRHAFADLVSLIGLYRTYERLIRRGELGGRDLLPVCGHAILHREDGNGVHGQFVSGTEDSDRDFLDNEAGSLHRSRL
jgi:hypothetical protein